jgi:uncharacterized membrane protein YhaH (DUF805 family)
LVHLFAFICVHLRTITSFGLNRYLAALEKRQMLRTYFGGLTNGRLARLPFLGFWVLLWVLFLLYGLGIAFGIGVVEPLVFEGLEGARGYLLANYGLAVLVALAVFCLAFGFAQLNLIAKRLRDMGLPGWLVLLVLALASVSLGYILPPGGRPADLGNLVNGAFNGILLFALMIIPSGLFARQAPPAPVDTPAPDGVQSGDAIPENEAATDPAGDPESAAVPSLSADHGEGDRDGPGEGEADPQGTHQGVEGAAIDPAPDQSIDQEKDQDGWNDDDQEKELTEIQEHSRQQ